MVARAAVTSIRSDKAATRKKPAKRKSWYDSESVTDFAVEIVYNEETKRRHERVTVVVLALLLRRSIVC